MSYNNGPRTYTAGEDLAAYRRVKIESGTVTTPPEVVYADAGEKAIGVTAYDVLDGEKVKIQSLVTERTLEATCVVSSAIARGDTIYGAVDGKVSDAVAGSPVGLALDVGATGAVIEFIPAGVQGAGTIIDDTGTIADPGDGEAIPVLASGVVPITTGETGETRTLAIPTVIAQRLTLVLDVDGGGDAVVTASAAVNTAGNTVITMGDAGDVVDLVAVQVAGALVWRIVGNDTCALSTP